MQQIIAKDQTRWKTFPATVRDAHDILEAGANLAKLVEDPSRLAITLQSIATRWMLRRLQGDHILLVLAQQRAEDSLVKMSQLGIGVQILAEDQTHRALRLDKRRLLEAGVAQIVARQVDLQRLGRLPAEGEGVLVQLVDVVHRKIDQLEIR